MTANAYIKLLEKRIELRRKALKKLGKRNYNPFSYKDYNAFYIQEEIKFIQRIIVGVEHSEL